MLRKLEVLAGFGVGVGLVLFFLGFIAEEAYIGIGVVVFFCLSS